MSTYGPTFITIYIRPIFIQSYCHEKVELRNLHAHMCRKENYINANNKILE